MRCSQCKKDKSVKKFNKRTNSKRGYHPYCKKCHRSRTLKQKYNLTLKEYKELLVLQGGVCAVCGGLPNGRWKYLHVDHNHLTGKVRGLLCFSCNTSLGHFERNRKQFEDYLDLAR